MTAGKITDLERPAPLVLVDLIGETVDAHPDEDVQRLAELVADRVPQRLYRAFLVGLIKGEVSSELRYRAHRVEQEARRKAEPEHPALADLHKQADDVIHAYADGRISVEDLTKETERLEKLSREVEAAAGLPSSLDPLLDEFHRLHGDPAVWRMDGPTGSIWRDHSEKRRRFAARFRRWCNETHADDGGFNEWLSRGIELWDADREHMADFGMDWVPKEVKNARFTQSVWDIVQEHAEHIRFEVTAELLGSAFAVGDGTQVTWRDATVEQHRERVEMLTKMAAGTAETAAMHQRAMEMIEAAGVDSLGDLPDELAA